MTCKREKKRGIEKERRGEIRSIGNSLLLLLFRHLEESFSGGNSRHKLTIGKTGKKRRQREAEQAKRGSREEKRR